MVHILIIFVKPYLRTLNLSKYIYFNSSETTNLNFNLDTSTFKKIHGLDW